MCSFTQLKGLGLWHVGSPASLRLSVVESNTTADFLCVEKSSSSSSSFFLAEKRLQIRRDGWDEKHCLPDTGLWRNVCSLIALGLC